MNKFACMASALLIAMVAGCGGSTQSAVSTPIFHEISVTLSGVPNAKIGVGTSVMLAAQVSNDERNAGVIWMCLPAGFCGSFTSSATKSGDSTTYTAPATVPDGGAVTIAATSATDRGVTATAQIPIVAASVALSFDQPPPSTVKPGEVLNLSVGISPASTEVIWSCAPTSACGSFSVPSTGNDVVTAYTVPVSISSGNAFTITATSADQSFVLISRSTLVSGSASNETLSGRYALFISSPNGTRGTASLAGSVNFGGDGTISGGVLDVAAANAVSTKDLILPTAANPAPDTSSYSVSENGHGSLTIRTVSGQQLGFSFVLTSVTHALVAEIDGNPGSGSLDFQNAPSGGFTLAQINGSFSFTMTGTAVNDPSKKVSAGGFLTSDGNGNLTAGSTDVNSAGTVSTVALTGTYTAPDADGRGTMQLNGGRVFEYYAISPKALRLLEVDGLASMGGSAFTQGSGFPYAGNVLVYQHSGWTTTGIGLRTTLGNLHIPEYDDQIDSGVSDSNVNGAGRGAQVAVPVTGSVTGEPNLSILNLVDAGGNSTFNIYVVDRQVDVLDPNNSLVVGAFHSLLLHTDADTNGVGILIEKPNPSYPAFTGNQALSLTATTDSPAVSTESDLIAVAGSDGVALFSGTADYDVSKAVQPSAVINASFMSTFIAYPSYAGRFTGTATIPSRSGSYPFIPEDQAFSIVYYQIDGRQAFTLQADASANSYGYVFQQVLP